ncbi:DNA adenine methylase [Helicobacter heilmannii]|uniref:site-specific DNA-methyltransferase (adenine-specific) n=1 Tax=Helicobacter heilmannii TaxID=35817 RepID=A0A0K2Y9Z1_HELHE|nr:DNA adenine methylase [Helicobacter heilmannii]BDQ26896.1 restriction endonuclease subunit M [Helicobacter heilmannii]CCM12336.1 Methyl-directed repair DNA adenine methylase [Helicobacter heilmannii ASB1.4]CRI34519.1 Methyl-directed repair DNA adenine methylase [Helicobacter heilmannii]
MDLTKPAKNKTKKLLSWIGGKHYLANTIKAYLPLKYKLYCEPFCGGASIFFKKSKSPLEVINDINGDLINFYRCVKHHPQTLLEYIHAHPINREWFENDLKEPTSNKIERAARWFLRIRLSYRGTTTGFIGGRGATINTRALQTIQYIKNLDFTDFARRLKGVMIENMDGVECIQKYDLPDSLFYIDPPYVGSEDQYAKHFGVSICDQLHTRLSPALKELRGRFLLSYNDCEAVRELYSFAYITPVQTTYAMKINAGQKTTQEILISNFKLNLLQ